MTLRTATFLVALAFSAAAIAGPVRIAKFPSGIPGILCMP